MSNIFNRDQGHQDGPVPKPGRRDRPDKRRGSWLDSQPARRTRQGTPYTDRQMLDDLRDATLGVGPPASGASFLFEMLGSFIARGDAFVRVYELRDVAPQRVAGALRLSARAQDSARKILAKGEARATGCYLPFRARMHKELPEGGPLQHGWLVMGASFSRGVLFQSVPTPEKAYRAVWDEWHELPDRAAGLSDEEAERGCPFIVGDSDCTTTWEHLSARPGADLAIFQTGQPRLWLIKLRRGVSFPKPLDALRKTAQGE